MKSETDETLQTNCRPPQGSTKLPWSHLAINAPSTIYEMLPAHYTVQTILEEIFLFFERKLNLIAEIDSIDKQLGKSIRRGEDSHLTNLLRTLNGVCETCLPSVLQVLIKWYEQQQRVSISEIGEIRDRAIKRTLAASYLFCIVLIEVLPQIHFHPTGCDAQINFIVSNAFKQISYRDPAVFGNNYENSLLVAEIFSEVIGILSQSHSKQIQDTFLEHLNEFRKEVPNNSVTVRSVISLLMGMKFFRVKTSQVSEFEMGVSFLNNLGSYFLEVDLKQKDLKHALAGLLVEILLPMAAQIKTEANIPALISFVEKLYGPTYELVNKKQHKMAAYPLLTCLLCISQSKFFLATWVQFLNLTLANLKNKDSKVSRMALESLYRLIWVYIIRISCEGNTATRSRLESICGSLFPRGSRNVVPRDAPLNIFVKIIHFIAQFKIDFAFKEIIFDLLGCTRASRQLAIYPERMNIGIRALMVIADGLQQKEGPPGMPRSIGPISAGTVHRAKRNYITRPLSMDVAHSIGLEQYYPHCRKALDAILRTLDAQIGRSFMLTAPQMRGKEYSDIIGADLKAKMDLFRTCIAAIPRLLPDPMSHQDLIEFLTRMCIHVDEELRATAYQSLQNIMIECPEWREDIIHNFLRFFTNSIQDTFPTLLESVVRLLLQLLSLWKSNVIIEQQQQVHQPAEKKNHEPKFTSESSISTSLAGSERQPIMAHKFMKTTNMSVSSSVHNTTSSYSQSDSSPQFLRAALIQSYSANENINSVAFALHCVEGLSVTLFCQLRHQIKRIAISLLKEVKQLLELLAKNQHETAVIDVLDAATPLVIDKYIQHISETERKKWPRDFTFLCDKLSNLEADPTLVNSDHGNEYMRWDAWACALSGFCERQFILSQCTVAVSFAWPILFVRFTQCNQFVDPSNPQNESRSSLLRSSKSKSANWTLCGEILGQESCLSLWQKYLVMVFGLCHPNSTIMPNSINQFRSLSPCMTFETTDVNRSMISSVRMTRTNSTNCIQLMQKASTLIRWEATDIADSVVLGIGSINPDCFELLLEEFSSKGIFRESQDRKNESNIRRKKRKDLLRLQLIRILELAVFRGLLTNGNVLDRHSGSLSPIILEFVDSIRFHVESDAERDMNILTSMRLHFAKLIALIVNSIPLEIRDNLLPPNIKHSLIFLFHNWGSRIIGLTNDRRRDSDVGLNVEQKAIQAMCSLTSLGCVFDSSFVSEEDTLLRWLEAVLTSANPVVDAICEEMLCVMLHLNEHHPRLFEHVLQMCYVKSDLVSGRCFRALAMLFAHREFPCEYISLLCLCQSFAADIESSSIRQTACYLIQILRHQFLYSAFSPSSLAPIAEKCDVHESNLDGVFPTNQLAISRQFSRLFPQLTMPIFSEVCYRIETARPNRQNSLLTLLPEWLNNVVLMDPNCDIPATSSEEKPLDCAWGSEESTQLILNNLIYLTGKLANEHHKEVGAIWHCLATSYSSNLAVIVHYLFVMLSLSLENMLPLAKKVISYLLEARGGGLVSMLVEQLQKVGEPFKLQLCRSEMAPFYRWIATTNVVEHRTEEHIGELSETQMGSAEEGNCDEISPNGREDATQIDSEYSFPNEARQQHVPNQLPMPPYGGNYCRLSAFLPPPNHPIPTISRNNLALFLLCDLFLAEPSVPPINWNTFLPKLLHMAVINLDAHRPFTCSHSRQILLNICLYCCADKNVSIFQVANTLLRNQGGNGNFKLNGNEVLNVSASSGKIASNNSNFSPLFFPSVDYERILSSDQISAFSQTELLNALFFYFSKRQNSPIWEHEDATARCWNPESVKKLERLVRVLVNCLAPSIPGLTLNWADFAMDFALTSNNRHLAGRSLQTLGALGLGPAPFMQRILSRLAEVVGDNSEETQSYITDIFCCLQNLAQNMCKSYSQSCQNCASSPGHSRSISYTQQFSPLNLQICSPLRKTPQKKTMRHSLLIGSELSPTGDTKAQMVRCRSATTLKMADTAEICMTEEDTATLSQLMFIGIVTLDSCVDNEFLLGLHLLDKALQVADRERQNCLQKLNESIEQLGWTGFPGIVGLSARGTLFTLNGYDCALSVLCKCIPFLDEQVVSPNANNSFALIIAAALPYFIHNFESPTLLCSQLAQAISIHCQKMVHKFGLEISSSDHPLCNLITMMSQFRERSFPRERTQWTKCVVNYLLDAFGPCVLQLILFLTEMLEKSPPSFQSTLLDVIHLLFNYGKLSDSPPAPLNFRVIRVIAKHVHGPSSREAAKILKIITDQWSSISFNCMPQNGKCTSDKRKPEFELHYERTLREETAEADKAVDEATSKYKVSGRLINLLSASGFRVGSPKNTSILFSQSSTDLNQKTQELPKFTASASQIDAPIVSRADPHEIAPQHQAQQLISEDIGLDRMSSPNSLMSAIIGHRTSGTNSGAELASLRNTDSFPRVFKEFDFLEAEHDSISESTESCFNWLSTMRTPRCGVCPNEDGAEEGNQDQEDDLPDEDDYYNDEDDDEVDAEGATAFDPNKLICVNSFSTPQRHSIGSNESSGRRRNLALGGNVTGRRKGRARRPLSRASDSNDVSSDRTPIQSTRHSCDSSPSCPVSEDENIEEEDEGMLPKSPDSNQDRPSQAEPKNSRERFTPRSSSTLSSSTRSTPSSFQNQKPVSSIPTAAPIATLTRHSQQHPPKTNLPQRQDSQSAANSTITGTSVHPIKNEETSSSVFQFRSISLSASVRGVQPNQQMSIESPGSRQLVTLPLECGHHLSGMVEHTWNSLIAQLGNDQNGGVASDAIMLFTQLLRESVIRLAGILRDASHLLTTESSLLQIPSKGGISTQLSHSLNVVLQMADCPFLFVTPLFLRSSDLLTSQRLALFEIREHFDTFAERREQTIRALNSVKSSLKLLGIINSGGGESGGTNPQHHSHQFGNRNQQELLLCKSLHRLSFQLLLMLEKLLEMVQIVQQSNNSQEYDLTPAVASLHKELLSHLSSSLSSEGSPDGSGSAGGTLMSLPSSVASGVGAVDLNKSMDTLVLHTTNKQFRSALNKLAMLRAQYCSGGQFGCCDQTNLDVLLLHFCRSHHPLRMWALIGSVDQLRSWCSQLKEANVQLGILVRNMLMATELGEPADPALRECGSKQSNR